MTASFPYSPEKHWGSAVDIEKMSITSRVGDLSLSLPEASMGYIWCFPLPLLSRELGCLEHLQPEKPHIPFLSPAGEERPGYTLPVSSAFSAHLVVWVKLELLLRKGGLCR